MKRLLFIFLFICLFSCDILATEKNEYTKINRLENKKVQVSSKKGFVFTIKEDDIKKKKEFILTIKNISENTSSNESILINFNKKLILDSFKQSDQSISIGLKEVEVGENFISIDTKNINTKFNLFIHEFIRPINIPNTTHSMIEHSPYMRKKPYRKGILTIKFLEGMKVRIEKDYNNKENLVDKNGVSLTTLHRIIEKYKVKDIVAVGLSPEENDESERKAEAYWNKEVANMNLFYYLLIDEEQDPWVIIDEIRNLPFIEEALPEFIASPT